jgi:hypothetical protein
VAVAGEFVALLVNEIVVEAAPLLCGENVTVKFALWPADRVKGNDKPLMANSELPTLSPETVTLAPLAIRLAVCVPLVPTVTLPTPIVLGLTLNCPCEDVAVDPLSPTTSDESEAFEVTVTLPVTLPEDFGAKTTLNDVLWPGATVIGVVAPEMLKPVPLAAT